MPTFSEMSACTAAPRKMKSPRDVEPIVAGQPEGPVTARGATEQVPRNAARR